jgi:hypothetical protein
MNNETGTVTDPNAPLAEQDTTVEGAHDLPDSMTSEEFFAEHDRLKAAEYDLTRDYQAQVAQSMRDLRQYGVALNVQRDLLPMMNELTHVRSRDVSENLRFVFKNVHATFTLSFAGDDTLLAIIAYVVMLPTMPLPKRARVELINERTSAGDVMADIMAIFLGGHAGHKHEHGDELNFDHLKNRRAR